MTERNAANGSFAALRRFARARTAIERCDFCGAELDEHHQHLIEPERRRLVCVCGACAVLFGSQGETSYRRVPRRIRYLLDFRMTDAQWEGLLIPIQLAFFFHSGLTGRVMALYPSPAGPIESSLDLRTWDEIAQDNPALKRMSPDVEGLLVNRAGRGGGVSHEYFIAPVDECFKLAGLIRSNWRGLSGGEEAWKEIRRFFADLKARAIQVEAPAHA